MKGKGRVHLFLGESGLRDLRDYIISAQGNEPIYETNTAYVTRADCDLRGERRKEVLRQYDALCGIVKEAGIEPTSPVNFANFKMNPVEANKKNHVLLREARFVVPLTAGMSTGRGWDTGFAAALVKPMVPFVRNGEKINAATVLLPTQIPVRYNDLTDPQEAAKWVEFFKEFRSYRFGVGTCFEPSHGFTLSGRIESELHPADYCMRCTFAEEMADLGKMIGKW